MRKYYKVLLSHTFRKGSNMAIRRTLYLSEKYDIDLIDYTKPMDKSKKYNDFIKSLMRDGMKYREEKEKKYDNVIQKHTLHNEGGGLRINLK